MTVEKKSEITIDDFLPYRKLFTAAVDELCNYHPMGVYYYVAVFSMYHCSYHYPLLSITGDHSDVVLKTTFYIYISPSLTEIFLSLSIIW